MEKYSAFQLLRHALSGNKNWQRAWRDPEPKREYDVIIVGAGGHGLATAYYLAKEHGVTNVAVLEKSYLGGGNTGRNTTIIRSNYMIEGNTAFYEHSMKLWEGISEELNYNVMFSQRGQYMLAHSPAQMDGHRRRGNIMRLNGIDAELISRDELQIRIPYLDYRPSARFPIYGALHQPRAGTARHDAVAWGYARAADNRGVDIIQKCEVEGYLWDGPRIVGVRTNRGKIRAKKVGIAVAGHTGILAEKAGLKLPLESHLLQAFVSEPVKPLMDNIINSGAAHLYMSQTDKGGLIFGAGLDMYNSYSQKGNLPLVEETMANAISLMPSLAKLRVLRHWAGIMDMTMDGSPIICKTPVDGFYIDGGWCYGGFKATPASGWCFAHTIAQDRPHQYNEKFTLERFSNGYQMDEKGAGCKPNAH